MDKQKCKICGEIQDHYLHYSDYGWSGEDEWWHIADHDFQLPDSVTGNILDSESRD